MYKYTDNYEIIVNNSFITRDNLINCMIKINNYNNYLGNRNRKWYKLSKRN